MAGPRAPSARLLTMPLPAPRPPGPSRPLRPRTMLWRGVRHRCPRCGSRGVFESFFRMRERCPGCGYQFVREPGFWLGAYIINFGVGEAFVGILLFVFALRAINAEHVNPIPWLVAGALVGVLAPVLLFPMSRTVWAAFDLWMHPLDPGEEAEARLATDRAAPQVP